MIDELSRRARLTSGPSLVLSFDPLLFVLRRFGSSAASKRTCGKQEKVLPHLAQSVGMVGCPQWVQSCHLKLLHELGDRRGNCCGNAEPERRLFPSDLEASVSAVTRAARGNELW